MTILLISPEVTPFAKTGGLADVSWALPNALNASGQACSIILPLYKEVRKNGYRPRLIKSDIKLRLGQAEYSYNLRSLKRGKTAVFFIENDEFFGRENLYNTPKGEYKDNPIRFAFFDKAVLASLSYIGMPDILHCNDWQTALIPLYLKRCYRDDSAYKNLRTLFTIHNMAYQGRYDISFMPALDLPEELNNPEQLEFYGGLNLMKAGIIYSNAVSTVSKAYAGEIMAKEYGCGLEGLLQRRRSSLYGILNGVDYSAWSPGTDKFIVKKYNGKNLKNKLECKKDLLKDFGFSYGKRKPVLGMITRLDIQKGLDLVADCIKEIISLDVYFVLLGTGSEKYNNLFKRIAQKHKGKVGVKIAFDNALAHRIEAGSDMFLMPSRYEPCGLNQMYSLRYATIPIVRATGGLDDTIDDFNPLTKTGNGFKFKEPTKDALFEAIKRAVEVYKDQAAWEALQQNALQCDFSWGVSAEEYIGLYKKILQGE